MSADGAHLRIALVALSLLVVLVAAWAVWRFVDFGYEPPGIRPGAVTVEVFNGCGVPRIARAVADEMLHRGFDVYEVGNCDRNWEQTTVVDLLDPDGSRAEAVAAALSVGRRFWFLSLRDRSSPAWLAGVDSSRHVDIRLVVGHDFRQFFPDIVALR